MSDADGKENPNESALEEDRKDFLSTDEIAQLGWETHRAYERIIGEAPTLPWEQLPEARRQEIVAGVAFILAHPHAPVSAQHDHWRAMGAAHGWSESDESNMIPFDELPWSQQKKAVLWRHIVHAIVG